MVQTLQSLPTVIKSNSTQTTSTNNRSMKFVIASAALTMLATLTFASAEPPTVSKSLSKMHLHGQILQDPESAKGRSLKSRKTYH
jgi:hypothetical protein